MGNHVCFVGTNLIIGRYCDLVKSYFDRFRNLLYLDFLANLFHNFLSCTLAAKAER